jgi:hypothetical protein
MIYPTRPPSKVDSNLGHNNAGPYLTDDRFMLYVMHALRRLRCAQRVPGTHLARGCGHGSLPLPAPPVPRNQRHCVTRHRWIASLTRVG